MSEIGTCIDEPTATVGLYIYSDKYGFSYSQPAIQVSSFGRKEISETAIAR